MEQLKLGLIGAGERGAHCYAPYALKYPREATFVTVAEPDETRRNSFGQAHGIPAAHRYPSWEQLLAHGPALDGVVVATQDRQHYEPVMVALEKGLHVLCEKPMAETLEKSRRMVEAAEQADRLLMVCHVLRYTPFFSQMKRVIASGALGKLQAAHHIENIGSWHFAHSYVRGNWRRSDETTAMMVAKCSHDTDILNYLLGKRCLRLSSFGRLGHFTPENAPQGAAKRCGGCPLNKDCQFSAYHYYEARDTYAPFRRILENMVGKPLNELLPGSPYERCVYYCDNDAVDRQTVQMEYEGGLTVSFTASAFTADVSRRIKIMGTLGEVEGRLEDSFFHFRDFATGREERHAVYAPPTLHAGGDERIMAHFCAALRSPTAHPEVNAGLSLAGHTMAFAAEESRKQGGKVIELADF